MLLLLLLLQRVSDDDSGACSKHCKVYTARPTTDGERLTANAGGGEGSLVGQCEAPCGGSARASSVTAGQPRALTPSVRHRTAKAIIRQTRRRSSSRRSRKEEKKGGGEEQGKRRAVKLGGHGGKDDDGGKETRGGGGEKED